MGSLQRTAIADDTKAGLGESLDVQKIKKITLQYCPMKISNVKSELG